MSAVPTTFVGTYYPSGGASLTRDIVVSGSNPVLIVHVTAFSAADTGQFPTGVTWSLGGSLTRIASKRNTVDSGTAYSSTWVLAAPAPGSGTLTVTYNVALNARATHIIAELWTGVDQTTPCPVADVVQVDTDESTTVATPTNLTAADATSAVGTASYGGFSGVTPTFIYIDGSSGDDLHVETASGIASGTTGVTFSMSGLAHSNHAITAVRIQAAAGGGLVATPAAGAAALSGAAPGRVVGTVLTPATP